MYALGEKILLDESEFSYLSKLFPISLEAYINIPSQLKQLYILLEAFM
jgi:hypothetical protein